MACVKTLIGSKEQEKGPILNTHLQNCLQNNHSYDFIIINNITSLKKKLPINLKNKK